MATLAIGAGAVIGATLAGCSKKSAGAPDRIPAAGDEAARRLLALHPIASLEGGLTEKLCAGKRTVYEAGHCEGFEHDRSCILAHHGHVFSDRKWKNTFSRKPWYQPRPDFADSDLPAVAMANVRELDRRAAACREAKVVTEDDQKRVRAWLETKKLPPILAIWGEPQTADAFALTLAEFSPRDELLMRYMTEPESEANRALLGGFEGRKLRHLSIEKVVCPAEGAPAPEGEGEAEGEGEGEEMECYNPVFFLTLDEAGTVIALWGTAAG
jgi:hypothetical protein